MKYKARSFYFTSFCIIFSAIVLTGCGSNSRKLGGVRVPPGVNPIIAVRADSLSRQLFVQPREEIKADGLVATADKHISESDSLWSLLKKSDDEHPTPSVTDSTESSQKTVEGYQKFQKAMSLIRKQDIAKSQKLVRKHLEDAENSLVKALELNPLSTNARRVLAAVYKLYGDRFSNESSYDRAIDIWGTLVLLEPGEYWNYYKLGQNYFASFRWKKALESFENCENTLLQSAAVNDKRIADPSLSVEAATDSSSLFAAVYFQAQSAIHLIDENKALSNLHRARRLAPTKSNRTAVESYITWINWDDGNIVTATMKDSASAMTNRGDFKSAEAKYRAMLSKTRTSRAYNDVTWNLARLEYTELNKPHSAVARLLDAIKAIPKESTTGAPIDSSDKVYFNTYGAMCHNLGVKELEKDRKLAYTYFMQSSSVQWKGRGKSYFYMARLATANPLKAIEDAENAYQLAYQLESKEIMNLHKLLIMGYRRTRDFKKAKFHLQKLKILQRGASSHGSTAENRSSS